MKKIKIDPKVRSEFIRKQNIFIEAIARIQWPKSLKDVALVLYRKTLGFNKMSDCITRKQIADALGLERDLSEPKSENKNEHNITTVIKILQLVRFMSVKKRAMTTRGGYMDEYTLLDPSGWLKYESKRGLNGKTSKSLKRSKSTTERGLNPQKKEVYASRPNKLNTNELQRKDLGEQENSPSGLSGPSGSTTQDHAKIEILNLWDDECQSDTQVDTDNLDKLAEQLREKMDKNSMMGQGSPTLEDAKVNLSMISEMCDIEPEDILRKVDEMSERDWEGIFNWDCFCDTMHYLCNPVPVAEDKPTGGIGEIDLSEF